MILPAGSNVLLRQPVALLSDVLRRPRGAGPQRFALIGGGISRGAAGHRFAYRGELARSLKTLLGSSCEVEQLGDAAVDPATVLRRLAGTVFHGAVVAIGPHDALRLTPVADWGARLVDLVDAVQSRLPEGAPVVLVGCTDVHVSGRVRPAHPVALRHARRLDRVAQRLADVRPDLVFLPMPRLHHFAGRRPAGAFTAAAVAPGAGALVAALRTARTPWEGSGRYERFARPEVHTLVEAARPQDVAALQAVVDRAAAEFAVGEAMLTLFDGDRSWQVRASASAPVTAPRALPACHTVVVTDEPLVVEDGARDGRFAAFARRSGILPSFYAGVPVHAEDGVAIGALCLLDAAAGPAPDLERLRELAREAEAVLRAATVAAGWLDAVPVS